MVLSSRALKIWDYSVAATVAIFGLLLATELSPRPSWKWCACLKVLLEDNEFGPVHHPGSGGMVFLVDKSQLVGRKRLA